MSSQPMSLPRRIKRSLIGAGDILNGRTVRRLESQLSIHAADISSLRTETEGLRAETVGLRAGISQLSAHVNALEVSRNAVFADFESRLAASQRRADVLDSAENRLTFLERCLGVSAAGPAQSREDALDKLLDQRLAQLEARLIMLLEGSYLDRLIAAARAPAKTGGE